MVGAVRSFVLQAGFPSSLRLRLRLPFLPILTSSPFLLQFEVEGDNLCGGGLCSAIIGVVVGVEVTATVLAEKSKLVFFGPSGRLPLLGGGGSGGGEAH